MPSEGSIWYQRKRLSCRSLQAVTKGSCSALTSPLWRRCAPRIHCKQQRLAQRSSCRRPAQTPHFVCLQAPGEASLQRAYTYAAHKTAVKCVASSGSFLVSGGADDLMHLYDIKKKKDLGFLMNPGDGAVPCLELYGPQTSSKPTHLFTGIASQGVYLTPAVAAALKHRISLFLLSCSLVKV